MKFDIIPNEQTPRVNDIVFADMTQYIDMHRTELVDFLEFAQIQETAVGLAANQCSLDGERFMVRAFALRDLKTKEFTIIIDPHITKEIGIKEVKGEGCLTWKGRKILAERSRAVEVNYFTMDGEHVTGEIHKGFEGQIWQHEVNHLNGVEEDVVEVSAPEPRPIHVGRNDPCPCGSTLKYKKCCLPLL